MNVTAYASPDFARATLLDAVRSATRTLDLYAYQVTVRILRNRGLCLVDAV